MIAVVLLLLCVVVVVFVALVDVSRTRLRKLSRVRAWFFLAPPHPPTRPSFLGHNKQQAGGCGPTCTQRHSSDGNCLVCGLSWGDHAQHVCLLKGRTRGSWRVHAPGQVRARGLDSRGQIS